MKKFIVLAAIGIAAAIYQPVKAQVSVNINIGSTPNPYYAYPTVYSNHYIPARNYVYVERNRPKVYRSYYVRPGYRNYTVQHANYRPNVKYVKYNHRNPHHGRRH
jgi:hypothetical protein